MRKTSHIPIHSLEEKGKLPFEINKIEQGVVDLNNSPPDNEHRDDHYIFVYQVSGKSKLTIDFQDITLSGNDIFCIQPGQVHFGSFSPDTSAWILSVASEWIPSEFRLFLMESAVSNKPIRVNSEAEEPLFRDALRLLQIFQERGAAYSEQILKSSFDVCLHLFIRVFQQSIGWHSKKNVRPELITRQFKILLLSNFRIMKSPAEYAASLNITPAYLNEVVRETTGYSVSHWIHEEIILEAKRTLFYTDNSVKEIAFALGYSDPSYFIRLFKKVTGISPLRFRHKYPK